MLKKMLKFLGKGYKECGKGIISVPKMFLTETSRSIKNERAGELAGEILFWAPLSVVGFTLMTGLCLAGGVFITVGGVILLPISGVIDIGVMLSKLGSHGNASTQANDFSNPQENNTQQSTYAKVKSSLSEDNKSESVDLLNLYGSYTQAYIESFTSQPLHSDRIKHLQLSEEELKQLEDCFDSILGNVVDIPVRMNDHIYNLSTLEQILHKNCKDPFSNLTFTRRDIQPAQH